MKIEFSPFRSYRTQEFNELPRTMRLQIANRLYRRHIGKIVFLLIPVVVVNTEALSRLREAFPGELLRMSVVGFIIYLGLFSAAWTFLIGFMNPIFKSELPGEIARIKSADNKRLDGSATHGD